MLLITASMSIGIIWVRQNTSRVAHSIQYFERDIETLGRKVRYMSGQFAKAHTPENLLALSDKQLSVPANEQVVWLSGRVNSPMIAASYREPLAITFDLALLGQDNRH